MIIALIIIIISLVIIIIFQGYRYSKVNKEIFNISKEIASFTDTETCKTLLYTTDTKAVRELLTEVNKLIALNRKEQALRVNNETSIKIMLSNVSHDLKTPLTIILGYVEILENDKSLSNVEKEELLDKVNVRAKEVLNLINKFFSLAKLENGDNQYELEKIDVREISKQVVLSYYDILTSDNFNVDISIPNYNIFALGNREALERALSNLISNAYKYGGDGKFLGVKVYDDRDSAYLEVWDRGAGISKKDLSRIFERSYIGDNSRNKSISGSGLGLSITKKLVEIMNGSIEARSETYVKTSFIIKLNKLVY